MDVETEKKCYVDGTYKLPYVAGYSPFGTVLITEQNCGGCNKKKKITRWIAHNVHRSPDNPDPSGSYGDYVQISYYCDECYEVFEPLARKIWNEPESNCVLL